jgi:hypothetical protein
VRTISVATISEFATVPRLCVLRTNRMSSGREAPA